MSINIRHLTNGEMTVFAVYNSGVTPPTMETTTETILTYALGYAPQGEPVFCKPDLANAYGVLDLFYPNHPNCISPEHSEHRCIAESCKFVDTCEITKDASWNKKESGA